VGKLLPGEAVAIVVQLSLSLSKAHERGIVHRDIKPSNVFLCDAGAGELFVKRDVALAEPAVAATGAAPGLITGYVALSHKNALATECTGNECLKGSSGLAAAVIGLVTDHSSPAPATGARIAPWLGPGAAGIHGSF
jgi:serine/threonine protein kinase